LDERQARRDESRAYALNYVRLVRHPTIDAG